MHPPPQGEWWGVSAIANPGLFVRSKVGERSERSPYFPPAARLGRQPPNFLPFRVLPPDALKFHPSWQVKEHRDCKLAGQEAPKTCLRALGAVWRAVWVGNLLHSRVLCICASMRMRGCMCICVHVHRCIGASVHRLGSDLCVKTQGLEHVDPSARKKASGLGLCFSISRTTSGRHCCRLWLGNISSSVSLASPCKGEFVMAA